MSKKPNNTISRSDRSKFVIWISQNKALLSEKSDSDVAIQATKELGFSISTGNVRGERQAQFPTIERRVSQSPVIAMVRSFEERMNERMTALEVRLKLVEGAVVG